MEEYIKILKSNSLFYGIDENKIKFILKCMDAKCAQYQKDEFIISEGSTVRNIGIVLSGHGESIKHDVSGKTSIITLLKPGSFIGVLLSGSRDRKSPVAVQAQDNLKVLFINIEKIIKGCRKHCTDHQKLLRNYISAISEKALILHDRNDCLIKPTVRQKILTYLKRISKENESTTFTIPLDRAKMAEYINVDRSALSRELSKMKKDGIIDYYKNSFKFLHNIK